MFNASWLLVGAVYAVAVWLGRRAGADLPRRVALLFYLLVFIFFRAALTTAVVNLPVDFLKGLPPWSHMSRDHYAHNDEMNDIVLQIVPWAHQVRESWRDLDAPLWNHLSSSGYPLLANAQSAALSPLRFLALALPLGYSFAAEAAMKILIALTFAFLFCRSRGYGELASAAGAISFGFSSFILIWLHFPMGTAAAYLPAALYMVDRIVERQTFGRIVFAAGLWTALLFSGHPETAAHTFFVSLLYVLWIAGVERRAHIRAVGALCVALFIAALLSAPFLAPFAEVMTKSKRYAEIESAPPPGWYFSDWPSFIAMMQPRFFGAVPFEEPWGPAKAEAVTGFAGALGIAAWFAVLAHVIARRRFRSPGFFFVIVAVVVLGALFDYPLFSDLFTSVFHLAANTRLRLVFCFTVAILIASALDTAMKGERWPLLLGLLASSALQGYLLWSTDFPTTWHHDAAVLALLPSVLVLALAALVPLARRWREYALMLVIVAIVAELWTVGRHWVPDLSADMFYPTTPIIERLQELKESQPPNDPFRIVGTGPMLFPNVNVMFGLEDIRAHDPMAGSRYVGVLRVLTGYDTEDYFAQWRDITTGLLDFLNVRYIVTTQGGTLGDPGRFRMIYDARDGRIFENTTVLPRVFPIRNVILEFQDDKFAERLITLGDWHATAILDRLPVENDRMRLDLLAPRPLDSPEATVAIMDAAPTRLRVRVDAPRYSLVATSIPWWPGWKVRTPQRALVPLRINATFLGFVVPPGTHDVEVYYQPLTFWVGAAVALATVVALIAFSALSRRVT